jgi:hypothetical protein
VEILFPTCAHLIRYEIELTITHTAYFIIFLIFRAIGMFLPQIGPKFHKLLLCQVICFCILVVF